MVVVLVILGHRPKKKPLFFVSNDTMKGPESRKKFF